MLQSQILDSMMYMFHSRIISTHPNMITKFNGAVQQACNQYVLKQIVQQSIMSKVSYRLMKMILEILREQLLSQLQ